MQTLFASSALTEALRPRFSTVGCVPTSSFLFHRTRDLLQLPPPIQFLDKAARIPPARFDLHEEFEKNLAPHHLLDIEPGRASNLLEHLAALAEQNGFLPVALAKNRSRDPRQPRALFKLFNQHGDGVRNLFMRLHENMLADRLRHHEAHRLIGDLLLRKIAGTVGQSLQDARQQFVKALLFERRYWDDLFEIMQALKLCDQR